MKNDKASGKITIAARFGLKNAKFYHTLLTFFMFTCFIGYNYLHAPLPWYRYAYALVFLFQFKLLVDIPARKEKALDPLFEIYGVVGIFTGSCFCCLYKSDLVPKSKKTPQKISRRFHYFYDIP